MHTTFLEELIRHLCTHILRSSARRMQYRDGDVVPFACEWMCVDLDPIVLLGLCRHMCPLLLSFRLRHPFLSALFPSFGTCRVQKGGYRACSRGNLVRGPENRPKRSFAEACAQQRLGTRPASTQSACHRKITRYISDRVEITCQTAFSSSSDCTNKPTSHQWYVARTRLLAHRGTFTPGPFFYLISP